MTHGADKIQATRGHRFWHEGRGWQMAKQLVAGIYLRSATGPVRLDTADPADQREAFNLVVDEFHTYFVGSQRILVHDNTAPRPALGTVPGQVLSAISEHEGFQLLNRSE